MQVPVGAVAEKSVPNTAANGPSSLFKAQKDAVAATAGLLPPFAQVLTENSLSITTGLPVSEDVGGMKKSATKSSVPPQETLTAAELRHKPLSGKLLDELQSALGMQIDEDQNAFRSKSESKSTGGRRVGEAHSSTLEKKAHFILPHTESPALVASSPVITTPIQFATAPALKTDVSLGLHLPPVSSTSQQVISTIRVQKGEHFSEQGLGQDSLLSANPDKSSLSMTDVLTPAMQHADSAAKTRFSHLPAEMQSAETTVALPEVLSSVSRNLNKVKTSPARASEADKRDDILKTAETAGHRADPVEAAGVISKLKKTPEKMGEAKEGTTVPAQSSSAHAFVEVIRMNGNAPLGPVAPHGTEAVTNSAKQVQMLPDNDAFQQLDSGPAPTATLLHSSAHQIAVGIHDPSLGWLEVQTQYSQGHINATLTAGTTEAHTHLAAQAPAITQYLADRQVFVHSLNVHTQSDAQNGASSGGQPHTGTGNAREQANGRGEIIEARLVKASGEAGEISLGRASNASYISVHA